MEGRLKKISASYLVYSQIWLNYSSDDHQFFYIFPPAFSLKWQNLGKKSKSILKKQSDFLEVLGLGFYTYCTHLVAHSLQILHTRTLVHSAYTHYLKQTIKSGTQTHSCFLCADIYHHYKWRCVAEPFNLLLLLVHTLRRHA